MPDLLCGLGGIGRAGHGSEVGDPAPVLLTTAGRHAITPRAISTVGSLTARPACWRSRSPTAASPAGGDVLGGALPDDGRSSARSGPTFDLIFGWPSVRSRRTCG